MTTEADIGHGTLFKSGNDASPQTFTTFGEVTSITPPGIARDAVEATHMQSPEAWREFIAGLKDGGEVSIEFNFKKASATALMTEMALSGGAALLDRLIVFPDTSQWDFRALLTGFESEAPVDDKISATATFKISGKPTFTAAA